MSDRYLVGLCGVLAGYAMMGKGFAYFGFPPIFTGEAAFLCGIIVFLRIGSFLAVLATLPAVILAALMAWVMLRTLPFVGTYGIDALRDSVVILYGGFAFIVVTLLLEDARRIATIVRYYGVFLNIYVPTIPFLFAFNHHFPNYIPNVPGTSIRLLFLGNGEIAVHSAGAAVFALAGFRTATPSWVVLLLATAVQSSAQTRGGMLAFVLPVTFAALVVGKVRVVVTVLATGLLFFVAAYTLESALVPHRDANSGDQREFSTRQIMDNVGSLFSDSGGGLQSTKEWRLEWWKRIIADTVYGPNFWTGRGFGLNIAYTEGLGEGDLRSPHNVIMTILARAGVPGLAAWLLFIACWLGTVAHSAITARSRGHTQWFGLFLFTGCYVVSCIINAVFDVALEGPMQGIWFWCLIGFGIGSAMVYRCQTIPFCQERAPP
jgi:hypothetical protein